MTDKRVQSRKRIWLRRNLLLAGAVVVLVMLVAAFWLRGALYDRFVRFPREEVAWQNLRALRQPVSVDGAPWHEYRGILHSHSFLSHDCEVRFEDILRALQAARLDFICLSDHPTEGRADFSRQWRGLHGDKLFIPGFEMKDGIMPFGVAAGVVLSNTTDSATLARQVVQNGGVLFYAHSEEPREWERPELTGMEIYNIHTDLKRTQNGLEKLLPDFLVSRNAYPDHIFRLLFHRPTDLLQHWDDLNRSRHITGIAGNDCHQNVGLRGFYTNQGIIHIEDTSPKTIKNLKLNWFTRPLARILFGPLQPGRKLFSIQLDPYERSARFVNTHVLAAELTEPAILEALRAGRVFVGFDMVADSSGFRWFAAGDGGRKMLGESGTLTPDTRLHAASPLPCRFTVLKDGLPVCQQEGRAMEWRPDSAGKYRVEAELNVLGEWVPWVYANPLELRAGK
jgi:hypothetical protein